MTIDEALVRLHAKDRPSHGGDRLFEWIMALMMLGIAFTLALPADTLSAGPLRALARYGITEPMLMLFFGIVGGFRCVALFINGRMAVWGPRIRAVGAMGAALVWAQLMVVLLVSTNDLGYVSIGVPVYGFLVLGELISIYRATYDAGYRGY